MTKQHPSFPSSQRPAGRPSPAQARSPKADYSSSTISQLGPMITLLPNQLYFRFHKGKDETVREILRHEGAFFFSSAHDQYRPYCSDFGPIDLSTVVAICRELRALLANPLLDNRPVIYYAYCNGAEQTNAAFALASYMMLVEGRTPEEAWAPFARVKPSPWVKFRDVTQETSELDLSILIDLLQIRRIQDAARQAQDSVPHARTKKTQPLLRCSAPGSRLSLAEGLVRKQVSDVSA